MPDTELDALLRHLLDSGVAPRYVLRLAAELEDHRSDLEEEALRRAATPRDAAVEARERLGDFASIAEAFAARRELKSWIHTSVWLVLALRALAWTELAAARSATVVTSSLRVLGRFATAATCAAALTTALLWTMQWAVSPRAAPLSTDSHPRIRTPNLRPAPRLLASTASRAGHPIPSAEAGRAFVRARPSRPGAPSPPPRPLPRVRISPASWSPVAAPIVAFDTAHAAARRPSFHASDGDLVLISRPRPAYPVLAARHGIEGQVVLEYTVTRTGNVAEVAVVESSNSLFNRAALAAANKFRFKPRVVHGEAVAVRGVRTVITFKLAA